MEDRTRKMKCRQEDEDGDTEKHTNTGSEPKVTNFIQQYHLRLFTSVCFIERKRKKLRRGVVCGSCFASGQLLRYFRFVF